MSSTKVTSIPDKQALADCRAQIDQIDDAFHQLLLQRADVVDEVRKLKGKQHLYIRPGREAQMMRALLDRPQGKIPEGLVTKIWREMISAFTLNEGVLKVGVYVPKKGPDLWDLARDYYGAFTPLVEVDTPASALKALKTNKIQVALLPPPEAEDSAPWWATLAADKANSLTVFASCPFEPMKAGRRNARNALPKGMIVGKLYPELTGDDRSFIAFHCVHVPEMEMKRLLGKAGYKVRQFFVHETGKGEESPTAYLAEVDGFIGKNDTRIGRLKAMLGSRMKRLSLLGGYPVPLKNAGRR